MSLVLLVKPGSWLEGLSARGGVATCFPLAGELYGVFAEVDEQGLAYATEVQDPASAAEEALQGIRARIGEPRLRGEGPWRLLAGGAFEASTLVLGFWERLRQDLDLEELLVVVPTRELLFLGGPEHLDDLRLLVEAPAQDRLEHLLSEQVYRWTGSGWEVLP